MPHDLVVADIKDECILGTDFLTPNRCIENGVLIIKDERIPLLKPRQTATPTCSKVTLDSTMDLPPLSEAVACGRVLDRPENITWGILEPDALQPNPLDGLLVVVDLDTEKVPVRLLNLTDRPRKIKKGTTVAICNPIESVLVEADNASYSCSCKDKQKFYSSCKDDGYS